MAIQKYFVKEVIFYGNINFYTNYEGKSKTA
jgi:hypothetical protein